MTCCDQKLWIFNQTVPSSSITIIITIITHFKCLES
jgi:hypothetical protein